jgi:hypothetical protein
MTLTEPQRRALAYLAQHSDPRTPHQRVSPAALARHLWPDSAAWQRRTRHYGSNHPGQLGGTMPMKAGTLLNRLADMGLAYDFRGPSNEWVSAWTITSKGLDVLREQRP